MSFPTDGYRFLHGVALAWHRGKLFASFAHNKGNENTDTEEARFTVSSDDGRTWSPVRTMDAGDEPGIGVSHGVFLNQAGRLWAFHAAYSGTLQNVEMRAYRLDDQTESWERLGTVLTGGFFPNGEPERLPNGNWIIGGFLVRDGNPPAVAISEGENLLRWKLVVLPQAMGLGKTWENRTSLLPETESGTSPGMAKSRSRWSPSVTMAARRGRLRDQATCRWRPASPAPEF